MKIQYRKRRNIFTAIGLFLLSFTSCNGYLDVDKYFDDTLTLDSAFTKRVYVEGFLSNAFEVMWEEVCDITTGGSGGYILFASDDLLRMGDGDNTQKYQNGEYSAVNTLKEDKWKRVYEPVRKASTFIEYVDNCKEMTMEERSDMKAQARFLRAYAYWVLLRQYGPLPLIPEEGFNVGMNYDELSVQRNTFEECVDHISKDFLLAAQNLPLKRTVNNIGRPTRGAALAARARLLLYAASPLYNGNTDMFSMVNNEGTKLIPQEYDEVKWAKAAAAALDVIQLSEDNKLYGLYTVQKTPTTVSPPLHTEYSTQDFPDGWADIDPFESYRQIFNGHVSASKNKEIIFTRPNDNKDGLKQLVELSIPFTLMGNNAIAVTLKQVNAYFMNDGRTIEEAAATGDYKMTVDRNYFTTKPNEYDFLPAGVCLQYANREPRFYASIAYPGSVWESGSALEAEYKNQQIFYYNGASNGKSYGIANLYPVTGVGLKKYYYPDDSKAPGGSIVDKFEPAIRYADVLMWYAEALNELTQSHKVTDWRGNEVEVRRDVDRMRYAMKPIRMRAGLPDYNNNEYNDRETFRRTLKRERQIEFFAESKRYYDLRRWKDAEIEENMPIMGYNMEAAATQRAEFYKQTIVTTYPKLFFQAMYFWPIPDYELIRNKRLTQNPGW